MSFNNITPAWSIPDEPQQYYVYAHVNPITKKIFYIGKGYRNRAFDKKSRGKEWQKLYGELRDLGLTHEIRLLHVCNSEIEALKKEKEEIRKHLKKNGNVLTNVLIYKERRDNAAVQASFGQFVKNARESKKMTQTELGKRARMPQTTVSKIETGMLNTTLGTVVKLTNALDLMIKFEPKIYK